MLFSYYLLNKKPKKEENKFHVIHVLHLKNERLLTHISIIMSFFCPLVFLHATEKKKYNFEIFIQNSVVALKS